MTDNNGNSEQLVKARLRYERAQERAATAFRALDQATNENRNAQRELDAARKWFLMYGGKP